MHSGITEGNSMLHPDFALVNSLGFERRLPATAQPPYPQAFVV